MTLETGTLETGAIEFSATTTLDDVMTTELAQAPRTKAQWWKRRQVIFFACFVVGLVGALSGTDDPTGMFKTLLTTRIGLLALVYFVMISLFLAALQRGLKAINKAFKRSLHVGGRRRHPAVDARDPALPITRTYRFDETGFKTSTAYDELWESWSRITGLDETPAFLIVRIGGGTLSYPLPKRQLAPELRERLQRFVDSRSSTKWPF